MINNYCKNIIKIPAEIINSPYNLTCLDENYKKEKLEYIKLMCFGDNNRQLSVPVLTISNKTGYYIDFVNDIINILKPRNIWNNFDEDITMKLEDRCINRIMKKFITNMNHNIFVNPINNTEHVFFVDTIYNPIGIGIVITGINRGGTINIGDILYLGPFGKDFKEVRVRSMHNYLQQKIYTADNHQRITIAIGSTDKDVNKKTVRKGMVLLKSKELIKKYVCWHFDAVITVFSHSATLKNGYCPSLQIGHIRQSARMIMEKNLNQDKDYIKTKEYAHITFKLKQRPEYIEPYQTFIFRSGCVHGVGIVLNPLPISQDTNAKPDPLKTKHRKQLKL